MTNEPDPGREPSERPLRVLIGCDTFSPDVNGAARFAERLAAGLVERGDDVRVVAPAARRRDTGARTEHIEGEAFTVYRLPSQKLWGHEWLRFVFPWHARAEARRILDEFRPDAVHIQSHILVGRGLAIEAAQRGIRIIATNHVMPENVMDFGRTPQWFQTAFLRWAWGMADDILSLADAVTTPTKRAAEFLERNTSRRDVVPVSCGIEAAKYTPDFTERTSNRVVFVGRINVEKHVEVILRAISQIDAELDVHFDIVGGGDQREHLERLTTQLGIGDRVVWHGKLSDEDLRAVLTRGSVFAIASVAELQSIATLEAMASGLPVVAADAMALPHLVEEGVNGYLFTPGDDAQLAEHLTTILRLDHDAFMRMQQASLRAVAAHDIASTLDTFEAFYRGEALDAAA